MKGASRCWAAPCSCGPGGDARHGRRRLGRPLDRDAALPDVAETAEDHVLAMAGSERAPMSACPTRPRGTSRRRSTWGPRGSSIPMVEEAEEVERAIRWSKFPPMGKPAVAAARAEQAVNDNLLTIYPDRVPDGGQEPRWRSWPSRGSTPSSRPPATCSASSVSKEGEQVLRKPGDDDRRQGPEGGLWRGGPIRWTSRRDLPVLPGRQRHVAAGIGVENGDRERPKASYMK